MLGEDELLARQIVPAVARGRVDVLREARLWEGDFASCLLLPSLAIAGDGSVADARVVVGAIAPTPARARDVERGPGGSPR